MITDPALLRLLQLVSPGLPIGVYSYSQGLERAIADGLVKNADDTEEWLLGLLQNCLCRVDVPLAARFYDTWQLGRTDQLFHWSSILRSWRETAELRDEDRQTGQALARLLAGLGITGAADWQRHSDASLPLLYMLAANTWKIPRQTALLGYLWSWLENQVLCAVKLIPLGQMAGQKLLAGMSLCLPENLERGLQLTDQEIGGGAFGLALSSSRHETQYCRLFRS